MGVDQIDHLQNIRMAERYGEYVTAFKVVSHLYYKTCFAKEVTNL